MPTKTFNFFRAPQHQRHRVQQPLVLQCQQPLVRKCQQPLVLLHSQQPLALRHRQQPLVLRHYQQLQVPPQPLLKARRHKARRS